MRWGELDKLLERLIRESDRRRGLGGYSTDAPGIYDLYTITRDLTLHILQLERQIAKKPRKK